jgi:hypothetical protein
LDPAAGLPDGQAIDPITLEGVRPGIVSVCKPDRRQRRPHAYLDIAAILGQTVSARALLRG